MKRHGDIFYKICAMENLREAHRNARKDKLFYKEVKMVDQDPDKYLKEIQEMLLNDTYEVSEYTVSIINDKGNENLKNFHTFQTGSFNGRLCYRLNRSSWKRFALIPVHP